MGVIRSRFLALAIVVLAAGGCTDGRRDVARDHLKSHAPEGFAVVAIPETLPIRDVSADVGELIASVRYRSLRPTVEVRDGFKLPGARESDKRFAELRGWALGSLPADAPLRAKFLAAIADAHGPFPVKRIVSPAGTEIDALITLTLRKTGRSWRVAEMTSDAAVPGAADVDPRIPLENAPEVAARIAELRSVADRLDATRREYLAARKALAEQTLAQLRSLLRTGRTFMATLPDGVPLRLVVTRGLESADPAAVVLTVQGPEEATARFTGTLEAAASGETVWRAAQITTLAAPAASPLPAIVDASRRPILNLRTAESRLGGELTVSGRPSIPLVFQPAGTVELLPEISPQSAEGQ